MKIINRINKLKNELGNRIILPAHHYEDPEIVEMSDFVGDSYKLAVDCARTDAEFIVFCGVCFMAEAAEAVTEADFALLASLVDKSLLRVDEDGRYDLHELIRQLSAEHLAADSDVEYETRDRHSGYYCAFLAERDGDLKGGRQKEALDEIEMH